MKKQFYISMMIGILMNLLFVEIVVAQIQKFNQKNWRKGALIMKVRENATNAQLMALQDRLQAFDVQVEKELLNGKALRLQIQRNGFKNRELSVAAEIAATGAAEFVELDRKVELAAVVPNDSLYSSQWHHLKVESEKAWDYSRGISTVKVAVCDAGFDLTHPDLVPNLLPGYNTVTGSSVLTKHFHGTETAGILAAAGNNRLGVAGMAWKIGLIPIQISDQPDGVSTFSDVAECIYYAADRGAKVVSISYDSIYTSSITNEASEYMRGKGGIVVVAAGNSNTDISGWGLSPNMMVVGATNSNDQLSYFSNYGAPVDIVAPGEGIFTTHPGATYKAVNGTSYSTPIVAGAAALIYSLKPSFTAVEVENFILSSAMDLGNGGRDLSFANGRLQSGNAVRLAALAIDQIAPTVSFTAPSSGATVSGVFQATVLANDNVGISAVQFFVDGRLIGTLTSNPYSIQIDSASLTNGFHTLMAIAKDLNGNTKSTSLSVYVNNKNLIVLDNLTPGRSDSSHSFTGTWCSNWAPGSYLNASLVSCGAGADTYRFTPTLSMTKTYQVSVRYTSAPNRSSNAKISVKSSGGLVTKLINMQVGGGSWVPLGNFQMSAGSANYVEFSDSNGLVSVDGVKFEVVP